MQMPAPLLCYRPSSCKMKAADKYVCLNKYTTVEEQIQMGPTLHVPLYTGNSQLKITRAIITWQMMKFGSIAVTPGFHIQLDRQFLGNWSQD